MTDIFTQFSRRSMPERAQKDFAMESSKDIVGSYLLKPGSANHSRAPKTTHEVLTLQTTEKAKIDVTAQVENHNQSDIEAMSMYLRSDHGSIRLRLRLPEAFNRAPLSLKMEASSGRQIVLILPRTFHGQLHVKQLTSGNNSSLTGSKVFRTNDAPMISKEVRDASLSVQATDYEVLCDIRPSGRHHHLGEDVAEVVAPRGRVHVKFESQTWKDARAALPRSVRWRKSEKKEPDECQTQ
ncbi:hypothetical protein K523DRAFT_49029 [Schizophyllum commune Tattone D]|nr:hypothetical protein K523DRAFT_49029 [Schizophyllum commune Tattone D]